MPASKAQQKAVTKYVKAKYDRFGLTMPKGNLDTIKSHAEARGESTNAFIGRAITETMELDTGGPQEAAGAALAGGVVSLPQEVDIMTEKEQATNMIDVYTDLLRIKQAADKEKEVNNQLRKAKAKLEALGVVVEDLVIE